MKIFIVILFLAICGLVWPNPYGVEILKTPTKEEALTLQESLLNRGYAPIGIFKQDVMYRVIMGKYDNAITPKWILKKLEENGIKGELVSMMEWR